MLGGFLEGIGSGLAKLGTGIGDFIGLDGAFGLGGADKAFSMSNLGDAVGDVFDFGDDVVKQAGGQSMAPNSLLGNSSKFVNPSTLTNAANAGQEAGSGLANMFSGMGTSDVLKGTTLPDILTAGGGIYSTMKQADAVDANLANQRRITDASLAEQARQVERQEEMDKRMADAYAASTGRG